MRAFGNRECRRLSPGQDLRHDFGHEAIREPDGVGREWPSEIAVEERDLELVAQVVNGLETDLGGVIQVVRRAEQCDALFRGAYIICAGKKL